MRANLVPRDKAHGGFDLGVVSFNAIMLSVARRKMDDAPSNLSDAAPTAQGLAGRVLWVIGAAADRLQGDDKKNSGFQWLAGLGIFDLALLRCCRLLALLLLLLLTALTCFVRVGPCRHCGTYTGPATPHGRGWQSVPCTRLACRSALCSAMHRKSDIILKCHRVVETAVLWTSTHV